MADNRLSRVIQQFAATLREAAGSDAELLERFILHRDDLVFEAILRRHGGMVFGVCRRLLGHEHDAEDAFQATFLGLARKAASIRQRSRLGTWLHAVAIRTSLEAKKATAKRRVKEATIRPSSEASEKAGVDELRALLDEEVARLPAKFRDAIVLCDLEGQGPKKVAQQLGCPEGTVKSRLTRARAMLGKRLARKGLASATALLVVEQTGTANVPLSLIQATIQAANSYLAGKAAAAGAITAQVAALTEGVIKTMAVLKVKAILPLVFVAGTFAAGGGWLYYQAIAAQPAKPVPEGKSVERKRSTIDDVRRELRVLKQQLAAAAEHAKALEAKLAVLDEPATATVPVSQPLVRQVTDFEHFIGRTQAAATVELRARVSGYLLQANFKEGAEVKRGELLFQIDPRPYEAELKRARAVLIQAEARQKRAVANLNRANALLSTRGISAENLDKAAAERNDADAAAEIAKAGFESAQLNMDSCRVASPIDGHISRRLVDPGNLVTAGVTILATIVSRDPIYVYFDVAEQTALHLRKAAQQGKPQSGAELGLPVMMGLATEQGFPRHGTVDFADNRVDPSTGALRMRAVFPNADSLMVPGLFARVRLAMGKPYSALLVPDRAVRSDEGRKYLFIVNEQNAVERRPVTLGPAHGDLRVVREGLKGNERVAIGGLQRLRPSMTVKPQAVAPGDLHEER